MTQYLYFIFIYIFNILIIDTVMKCSLWKGKGTYNIIHEKKHSENYIQKQIFKAHSDLLITILKLVLVMFNKDNFGEVCPRVGSFHATCKSYGEKKNFTLSEM